MTALREYLQEAAHDDALAQEIAAAYYDDEIPDEQLKALVNRYCHWYCCNARKRYDYHRDRPLLLVV